MIANMVATFIVACGIFLTIGAGHELRHCKSESDYDYFSDPAVWFALGIIFVLGGGAVLFL